MLELRGWEHFHAEGQIDLSRAVSTLTHGLVLSNITPERSCSYGPEGRKMWVALAGPRALTQRGPVGLAGSETAGSAAIAGCWCGQGNQIPTETQQHFIHTLSCVLPSCNCVKKARQHYLWYSSEHSNSCERLHQAL